ncbi:MAG: TrkA family potassium uptake protein [Sphaerochaetaceae bacterium]|nr:TrkA family potassium uptake protein [Sphaerochaetaceae bacterium]
MKRFAIIGLGNFGSYTAKTLYAEGHEVLAVDKDKARAQALDQYSTEAVVLDATNKDSLRALGLEDMDAVLVSTGTDLGVSTLICMYLNEMGVKRILVKASDDDHAKILKGVGANDIIFPERDMAIRTAKNLSNPNVLDFIPITSEYDIIQIEPPREFIGKSIRDLNLRAKYNVHIIAIKETEPEQFILIPQPDYILIERSKIVVIGRSEDIKRVKPIKRVL